MTDSGALKAYTDLDSVKNKPSLRTKNGTNMAFPAYDAAQKLEEEWEDSGDPDDLKDQLEEYISNVNSLIAALRDRTVIMT